MAGFKDFMKNLLYESVEEEVEDEVIEEPAPVQPVSRPQPVYQQPAAVQTPPVPPQQTIPTAVFGELNVEKISQPDSAQGQARSKNIKKNRNRQRKPAPSVEYQPVISPIFGNIQDDQKDLDLVHNAIELPKPPENTEMIQVISPMYGSQPVRQTPVKKKAAPAKENNPRPQPEPELPSMDLKTFLSKKGPQEDQ